MIQDRLTAKFQSAKPVKRREATAAKPAPKPKAKKDPIAEAYARGRAAAGSLFWL